MTDVKTSRQPLVSIIIPAYNCADFLGQTLDSALAQDYSNFEIIIVNDGSIDKTEEVVDEYVRRYGSEKIKYYYQVNGGVSAGRATGILTAQGKYIALLDADDLWSKDKLSKTVAFLESHPEAGMVFSDMEEFSEDGLLKDSYLKTRKRYRQIEAQPQPVPDAFEMLLEECVILPSTAVMPLSVLNKVGSFNPKLRICEDIDVWTRISLEYPIYCLLEPLVRRRIHDGNMSNDRLFVDAGSIQFFEGLIAARPEVAARLPDGLRRHLSKLYYQTGYLLLERRQDYAGARRHFFKSLAYRMNWEAVYYGFLTGFAELAGPEIYGLLQMTKKRLCYIIFLIFPF